MVPAKVTLLGAVAVMPPEKVNASELESPSVNAPVFANVTAFVTELVDPSNLTL